MELEAQLEVVDEDQRLRFRKPSLAAPRLAREWCRLWRGEVVEESSVLALVLRGGGRRDDVLGGGG